MPQNDLRYKNKIIVPKGDTLNVRESSVTSSVILKVVKKGEVVGTGTGNTFEARDGLWIQVTLPEKSLAYVSSDVVNAYDENAQWLLNKILATDEIIFKRILTANEMIEKSKAKGLDTSGPQKLLNVIQSSYNNRQTKLRESTLIKVTKYLNQTLTDTWLFLISKFGFLPGVTMGLGLAPIAIIGIAAAVVGTAGGAYLMYKFLVPIDAEQQTHLAISDNLKKLLDTAPPEVQEEIKKDLKNQLDNAYTKGYIKGKSEGFGLNLNLGFLIAGGGIAYYLLNKEKQ